MARKTADNKQQVRNKNSGTRKGNTERTSDEGRKRASGGNKEPRPGKNIRGMGS